ncbi:c-type cytochrome domain-containing protein [Candidatus Laterigemmans baculatus]|uniref:c-type cytochrome domain-containing protein n=1 Tax=Candidatus Laterigemmans baculatus TaxID=2770505 RepID=UPI0013DC58A5|nr:c-type cytochrome domain-containing protein [Candidatus Laterigemmans baculatus]
MRIAAGLFAALLVAPTSLWSAEPISFRGEIAPLLLEHCVACHGAKKAEGGYRVDTFAELSKAGDSGEPPIASADEGNGELLRRLTSEDEFERMPAESDPLAEAEIAKVAAWLAAGAKFDGDDPEELLPFVIPPPRHPAPPASYPKPVPATAIAFSPDGGQILVGGYHEVTVWDVETGSLVRRIENLGQRIFALELSPDGGTLAVACGAPGKSGEVRLVDFASGEVQAVVARSTDVVLDVAFRPATPELAIAAADRQIRIVNIETLETVRAMTSHADWVTAIAWSDDGSRMVSASRDRSAKVFDAESGELLVSYQGHESPVRGVGLSPDGQHVLSSGSDAFLHRWSISNGKAVSKVPLGGDGAQITRGEGFVLVPTANERVLQIELAKTTVARQFEGFGDWALSAAWHAESGRIAGGSFDGELRVWDAASGELIQSWIAKP